MPKLIDIADVVRSKNSGPSELTLDIIFKNKNIFDKMVASKKITEQIIADIYKRDVKDIISVLSFMPANAIKITMTRKVISGDIEDGDIYGAQQHAPLLNLEFNDFEDEL